MALADPPLLLSTAPTIEVGGQSYPLIASNLERLRVTEALGGLSSLELVLIDEAIDANGRAGSAAGAGSPLELGAGIRVFAGAAEVQAQEIFDGQITAVEAEVQDGGPPLFTVLAEDRLFAARRKRRTRLFEAKTLADIVNQIASDYGLTAELRDGVDSGSRDWVQSDETDLAFLRRVVAGVDCDVQIVAAKLQVGRIGKEQRTLVPLAAGSNLKQARITADIAEQVSRIRVASYDSKAGSAVDSSAQASGFGPGSGKTGADILAARFSEVVMHLGRVPVLTDADAHALAQYECDRRARAFVSACGTAVGNGQLRVGSWIALSGVNARFENQYAVTRAVHRYDRKDGYLTDFEAESAYLGDPR